MLGATRDITISDTDIAELTGRFADQLIKRYAAAASASRSGH